MIEQLLADCVADPDDDGPRLVWADAVGGARGELVVVQCDLARGGLTREQRESRKQRERELLDKHAVTWAGELATCVDRWSFRRGFIESVRLSDDVMKAKPLRELAPLVQTITLEVSKIHQLGDLASSGTLDGLRGLELIGHLGHNLTNVESITKRFQLRALGLESFQPEHQHRVGQLLAAHPIETLRITNLPFGTLERLLARVPQLTSLSIAPTTEELLSIVAGRSLRALQIGYTTTAELATLEGTRLAATLERLAFHPQGNPVIPALPALQQCEPIVDDELLHHDPGALLTLGRSWYRLGPPYVLRRLDTHDEVAVPAIAVFGWTTIGRNLECSVRIESPSVSRRHAQIGWHEDHHVIRDFDTNTGTHVNDTRVHRQADLRDGDIIRVGNVRLRYLVGDDARDRARR